MRELVVIRTDETKLSHSAKFEKSTDIKMKNKCVNEDINYSFSQHKGRSSQTCLFRYESSMKKGELRV